MSAAHASDPRSALRALICEWLERAREGGRPDWFAPIMAREMAKPTPALDRVAETMGSNYLRFRSLVGEVIERGPDDPATRMCVHSVVGQVLHYMQSRAMLTRLWPDLNLDNQKQRHAIADHIVTFSLAGMHSVSGQAAPIRGKLGDRATATRVPHSRRHDSETRALGSAQCAACSAPACVVGDGSGHSLCAAARQAKRNPGWGHAASDTNIRTATVRRGSIGQYIEALGTVTPLATVNLYSQVNGQVVAVHYIEGQIVHRGDPLIDIDPEPMRPSCSSIRDSLNEIKRS